MKKIPGGVKDANGVYQILSGAPPIASISKPDLDSDISIDTLLQRALRAIYGVMRAIEADIGTGAPARDTIMNLKDVSNMLWEFKKKEQEFLDNLSDDDLKKLIK